MDKPQWDYVTYGLHLAPASRAEVDAALANIAERLLVYEALSY